MSKKKQCINSLLQKLSGLDQKIFNMSEALKNIKQLVNEQSGTLDNEEECPDVLESEKALVEAIEKLYVEELLTREPEGDA